MARVDALQHELKDVEDEFAGLERGKLASVNAALKAKGIPEIMVHDSAGGPSGGGGGDAKKIAAGLIGLRLFDLKAISNAAESQERD